MEKQTALVAPSELHFSILWDPDAALSVNSNSVSVTDANPTGSFSISNTGTPGSTLTWNATATNYSANSNGFNWLTISPLGGSDLGVGSGGSVTITATPGICRAGRTRRR